MAECLKVQQSVILMPQAANEISIGFSGDPPDQWPPINKACDFLKLSESVNYTETKIFQLP